MPRHRALALLALAAPITARAQRQTFQVEETTIAQVHAAMRAHTLTCHALVQAYLDRIAAYDKRGPAINAIIVVNPQALAVADSLDRRFARDGLTGPLHCVPMVVKDNFETKDLPTTAGSLALEGWRPPRDATMVERVRAAGAVVLAKTNLAEWAFTPYETVSSILPGYTKNPYATDRVTAGSSGGTAAAVAASFAEVGLGTDTGNSIRGPSSFQALVGIRSTMGLTSRAGVVPLSSVSDVAGPMARTVADAVAVFQVVAGADTADAVTADADRHREQDYRTFLTPGGLKGARVGILHQAYERPTADSAVLRVFDQALGAIRGRGATVVDARVDSLDAILRRGGACNRFKFDLERYLAARGTNAPVHTVDEIVRSRRFHPTVEQRLRNAQAATEAPETSEGCRAYESARAALRTAVVALMDSLKLDALVYPTWSNAPRLIGDLNTPAGDNSQIFSPMTGFPAVTVPMGWTPNPTGAGPLPAGMTIFGRPWSEGELFKLAYDFEQTTKVRRAPGGTPALVKRF